MKFRNGFVSNSSSSSFILRNLPDSVKTWEDVYDFYGMEDGRYGKDKQDEETIEFCKMILRDWQNREEYRETYFFDDFFNQPGKLDEFLHYYDFCFKGGYYRDELDKVVAKPNDYWETSCDDTYLSGPGCAYMGSYITKNGIEINCH